MQMHTMSLLSSGPEDEDEDESPPDADPPHPYPSPLPEKSGPHAPEENNDPTRYLVDYVVTH